MAKKEIFKSVRGVTAEATGPFASVFITTDGDPNEDSDFRNVPASDRGNADYSDMGMRGSYAPHHHDPFPDPTGLKRFSGYGANEEDLSLGFVRPETHDDPAYDLVNYKDRYSLNRQNDEDFENTADTPSDYEFRNRNMRTRGIFKRPHIPTER